MGERRPTSVTSEGLDRLPNDQGQIWREYDISPYTFRVTSTERPQQAIIDWILRETGYEAWHSDAVTVLSANDRVLRVYHTPEIHGIVADIVDRFVSSEAESHSFSLRVATVGNPSWRTRAHALLRPINVESPGIQAWLLEKEDAALLLAELRKRSDFKVHSAPQLLVSNGQATTVTATRAVTYVKDLETNADLWPGFDSQSGQIDEGFALEMSPLLTLDGAMIDAVLKCNIDQVEKLIPVMLDVASQAAPKQRTKIEVPQLSHCRFQERFRWPTEKVLLVGLGVVATPVPTDPNFILKKLPISGSPPRADLLVFIENKGTKAAVTAPETTGRPRRRRF
jgi:hypothetical protein